jgi:protein-L-isoaspartate(D-aspartate) O-methyltransferase
MLELLDVQQEDHVLEVGTGLGYQTALLAELGARVRSVEIVEEFAAAAKMSLMTLGYGGVSTRVGDGSRGWAEYAPYDKILVTAAAREVLDELLGQLKVGGRMVIPVGGKDDVQQLSVVEKVTEDEVRCRSIIPVRFTELETVI